MYFHMFVHMYIFSRPKINQYLSTHVLDVLYQSGILLPNKRSPLLTCIEKDLSGRVLSGSYGIGGRPGEPGWGCGQAAENQTKVTPRSTCLESYAATTTAPGHRPLLFTSLPPGSDPRQLSLAELRPSNWAPVARALGGQVFGFFISVRKGWPQIPPRLPQWPIL